MRSTVALGTLVAGLWLAGAVAPVFADPPATLQHVDPNAPCFRWPAVDMDGDGVFDRIDHCPNTPKGCVVDKWGCGCNGAAGVAVNEPVKQAETPPQPQPAKPAPPASELERQLVETGRIRLENVYFETASSRLLPESEEMLREVGRAIEKYPDLRIEIEGHTDTRGWAQYNLRLSQARAEAVRSFLLQNFKLDANHYDARGYGETRPETAEHNQEELLRDRRVVLRVLNPDVLPKGVSIEHKQ